MIATEWNVHSSSPECDGSWPTNAPRMVDYLADHNIGLFAWAFDQPTTMIADWDFTPTTLTGFACDPRDANGKILSSGGYGAGELVQGRYRSAGSVPAGCSTIPANDGEAAGDVDVAADGTYRLWSRLRAQDLAAGTYWLQVDGDCPLMVGNATAAAGVLAWHQDDQLQLQLSAGRHRVRMIGRDSGLDLDRILLLADGCVPASTGDNCIPTAPPASTPATPPRPSAPVTPPAPAAPRRSGYWMVGADGAVYPFGDAARLGGPTGRLAGATVVDLEPTPSGAGYWVVDDRGRVYPYGDAISKGDLNPRSLLSGERATSLSATPSGNGYWIFTSRGRVVPFGDAAFYGDMAKVTLNGPVLDSIPTTSGNGYYMVASDGGIFAFGDAAFHGSMGGKKLNAAVQSLVPDGDGVGYWLVAADGGIFAFDAGFHGSMGATRLNKPVTGMVRFGDGYLMVGEDGGIFNFSDRPFNGSLAANPPAKPIVAVAVYETMS